MDALAGNGCYEVVVLVDHRAWAFPTGERRQVALTTGKLEALGLPIRMDNHDAIWLCGDYGLYVARAEMPHVRYFWLYEYDVRIHDGDPSAILDAIDGSVVADLLVTNLKPAAENYIWARSLSRSFANLYRCNFPLLRISASAIDVLLTERRRLAEAFFRGEMDWLKREFYPTWPNDEVFTATVLMKEGFVCRDFRQIDPSFYDESSFSAMEILINSDDLRNIPFNRKIYHSVRSGAPFLAALRGKGKFIRSDCLQGARKALNRYVGTQWSADQANEILTILDLLAAPPDSR